jgi:plastocyanin
MAAMTRGITALIACSALLLASGCGESSEPPKRPVRGADTSTGESTGGEYVPGPTTPTHLPPAGFAVTLRNIKFSPESVTVKVGSTVVWTNRDSVEHNIASVGGPTSFRSQNLSEGQSYQVTLTRPGLYRYLCTIHREVMHGTIRVVR